MSAYQKSKERNDKQKETIVLNEGKVEKRNGRRTSEFDAVLDLISFDAFVLLVLVNIKKEPGGSKSSRYVFYPQRNSTEKLNSKQTAGTDKRTNERVGKRTNERAKKETNERPTHRPTDRPAEQSVQHAYDVKFVPGDCTVFFP